MPVYAGPTPVFEVCNDNIVCIRKEANVAWTNYFLSLKNWAEDTEQLCKEENK